MKKTALWGLSLALVAALATPGFGQTITDQKEYDAYIAVFNETDNAKKAAGAEKFLADYPETTAKTQSYTMALLGYAQAANWAKAMEFAERQPQVVPDADNALKKTVFTVGLAAGQGLKNRAKTIEYAEKVLTIDANDLNALLSLSSELSQSLPADGPAKDAQIAKAADVTKRALSQPKPAAVPEAQWTPIQVSLHRTTCLLLLNQKEYPEAVAACENAVKLNRKDGGSYYLMGLAQKYQIPALAKRYTDAIDEYNANRTADQLTRDELKARADATGAIAEAKRDEAIESFAKAVAAGGVNEAQAELEALYKSKNNDSLAGLDQLVAEKKSEIGD